MKNGESLVDSWLIAQEAMTSSLQSKKSQVLVEALKQRN